MSNPVTISPTIQSGEPVFTNTRVPVKNLFDYLKAGHSLNEYLEDFPSVKRNQVTEIIDRLLGKLMEETNYSETISSEKFIKKHRN